MASVVWFTMSHLLTSGFVRSSQREFEQPAMQAVLKWQFRPGRKGGRAVNTRVQQVITFNLNEE